MKIDFLKVFRVLEEQELNTYSNDFTDDYFCTHCDEVEGSCDSDCFFTRMKKAMENIDTIEYDKFADILLEVIEGTEYSTVNHAIRDNHCCSFCDDSYDDHTPDCPTEIIRIEVGYYDHRFSKIRNHESMMLQLEAELKGKQARNLFIATATPYALIKRETARINAEKYEAIKAKKMSLFSCRHCGKGFDSKSGKKSHELMAKSCRVKHFAMFPHLNPNN